jgi:hypothetical protein
LRDSNLKSDATAQFEVQGCNKDRTEGKRRLELTVLSIDPRTPYHRQRPPPDLASVSGALCRWRGRLVRWRHPGRPKLAFCSSISSFWDEKTMISRRMRKKRRRKMHRIQSQSRCRSRCRTRPAGRGVRDGKKRVLRRRRRARRAGFRQRRGGLVRGRR